MDYLGTIGLPAVSPAQCCQAVFLLSTGAVLAIAALPPSLGRLLMDYGARGTKDEKGGRQPGGEDGFLVGALAALTSRSQVPHGWFITFYAASVAGSALWATQYLVLAQGRQNTVLVRLASSQRQMMGDAAASMTLAQVWVAWALMTAQGLRRLYECAYVVRSSKTSRMWFVHWLLGTMFYVCMSVAVWVEGSGTASSFPASQGDILPLPLSHTHSLSLSVALSLFLCRSHSLFPLSNLFPSDAVLKARSSNADITALPLQTIVGVPLFLAGAMQNWCHRHLAGLKKYSLPEAGLFRHLVCPHYTCECLIYLALAVAAAPRGQPCNRTLLCALLFVVGNLGATANGTSRWYAERFGAERVRHKWKMIPFVF